MEIPIQHVLDIICKQSGDACLLEGANLGNVHFVINIFVLDLYGQHFGNICKLNIYVGIRCKLPIIWEYCNLNIYFGIGYILGGICQVGGFCALCVHRVGEFVYFVIHIFVLNIRGATRHQIRIFFNTVQKGGRGSNPCSKILLQILYDLKGLLAT